MSNIELLILVSGIVLLAIINFYLFYYKEEQELDKAVSGLSIPDTIRFFSNDYFKKERLESLKKERLESLKKERLESLKKTSDKKYKITDSYVINFVDDSDKIIKKVEY